MTHYNVSRSPITDMEVRENVVIHSQIRGLDELDVAGAAGQNAAAFHRIDCCVSSVGQTVCISEKTSAVTMLAIPRNREPSSWIEVTFLLVQHSVEDLVDPG